MEQEAVTLRAVVEEARQRGQGAASESAITMSFRALTAAVCMAAEQLDDPALGTLTVALMTHADQLGCYYSMGRQLLRATRDKPETLERMLTLTVATLTNEGSDADEVGP